MSIADPRPPRIVSVNVSNGGVPKLAVAAAAVTVNGLVGDRQRDLRYHGGPDRAVCLYSLEQIAALNGEGHSIAPGTLGENLTISGLDWPALAPGAVLDIGAECTLESTAYAAPCKTIARSFSDGISTRIAQKVHPGWSRLYARVLRPGTVRPGDVVTLR